MQNLDIGAAGFGFMIGMSVFVQFAWHIAVIVLLYKIWQKVKHLPS